jgi:hypothetical protein
MIPEAASTDFDQAAETVSAFSSLARRIIAIVAHLSYLGRGSTRSGSAPKR